VTPPAPIPKADPSLAPLPPSVPASGTGLLPNPVNQDIVDALQAFLTGSGSGVPLSTSTNAGTVPSIPLSQPTASSPLLVLGVSTSFWDAPPNQRIYPLEEFLPGCSSSGMKGPRTITNPDDWYSAASALALAMASDPDPHQFSLSDFLVYAGITKVLFNTYQFYAVLEYDRAWRQWRRARAQKWTASNHVLRDMYLLANSLSVKSAPKPRLAPANPGTPNLVCHDFSRPCSCSRLTTCRYVHRCKLCKTTFPNSFAKCLCVGGTLPSGVSLPSGVTFGV
jgi:hypothetical protein